MSHIYVKMYSKYMYPNMNKFIVSCICEYIYIYIYIYKYICLFFYVCMYIRGTQMSRFSTYHGSGVTIRYLVSFNLF